MRLHVAEVVLAVVATVASSAAQSPGPPLKGRGSTQKPAVAPARTTSVRIGVRDETGGSLTGVRVLLSGAATGEFTTGAAGTAIIPNLKDGVYRVRCEGDGFITLEREFTLHGGAWNPIDVVLNAAPTPPPAAPSPPAPARAPETPPAAIPRSGPPVTVSIVDFLDRNFIGREPLKESILACKPLETVRLLQMREGVAAHVHKGADEVIYVVAGEGAVRIGE